MRAIAKVIPYSLRVGLFLYYTCGKDSCTKNFMAVFTENLMHVQTVCTRPFLLLKGPRDEATGIHGKGDAKWDGPLKLNESVLTL